VAYEIREAMTPDSRAIPPKNKGQRAPPKQDRVQKFSTSPKKFNLKGNPEAINQIKR